jgi:hypothetical protein
VDAAAQAAGRVPPPQPGMAEASAGDTPPAQGETLMALLQGLLHDLPGLVADRVELFALELERATRALAQIALLLVALTALGLTAWVALWIGFAEMLVRAGVPWLPVLLGVHALAIWLAVQRLRRLASMLSLPATRRHLTPRRAPRPPAAQAGETHAASTAAPSQ